MPTEGTAPNTNTYDGPRVDLIGLPDAAVMLGCSYTHVNKLTDLGSLVLYPWITGRQRMVTLESVRAYQHAAAVAAISEGA